MNFFNDPTQLTKYQIRGIAAILRRNGGYHIKRLASDTLEEYITEMYHVSPDSEKSMFEYGVFNALAIMALHEMEDQQADFYSNMIDNYVMDRGDR